MSSGFFGLFARKRSNPSPAGYQYSEGFLYDPQAQRLVFERVRSDPKWWFAGPSTIPDRQLRVTSGPLVWQNLVIPVRPQQGFIPEGNYVLEGLQNDPLANTSGAVQQGGE
jgi:hypothetical protein